MTPSQLYYQAHKEEIKAKNLARYHANKEAYKATVMEYYHRNAESKKEYQRRYECPYRELVQVPDGWVVHHFNHNHEDNRPENLLPMTHSDHSRYHGYFNTGQRRKALKVLTKYIMT
jgi:hypothetical protein